MPLSDFRLSLPYKRWTDREWPEAIRASTGARKRILQIQERAVHALAKVEESKVSPEALAWVVLWTRGFLLLQAAADLLEVPSAGVLEYLYRLAIELAIQVRVIRWPWDRLPSESDNVEAWQLVADRLRGFAAWGLTNDLVYYRRRLRRWELDAIYAPTDPRDIPVGTDAALHRYFFGDVEFLSRAEAESDKTKARATHLRRIHRLENWLQDPAFGHWPAGKLRKWIAAEAREPVLSIFALFDDQESVSRMLRAMDVGFSYAAYEHGSLLIHGSSIESFILLGEPGAEIMPVLLVTPEMGEQYAGQLGEICNSAMLGLWGLRDHCLSPGDSSQKGDAAR